MANFAGKYHYHHNENFEKYMETIAGAAGADAAKKFHEYKPYFVVTVSGDYYTFTLYFGDKEITNSFYLGTEFDEKTFYFETFKTVCKKYDNKLVFVSKFSNGNTSTREYEFTHGKVKAYYYEEKHGVTATVWFEHHA
ncbi:fatty acid-binding protein, liver-like [Aphidius gifuensis]|uniref:fatty acid-binding protein, liver-like n=1 Tax=Aphidius gifuensis TaxID=684658 RepID=UPI001CDB67E6|nr:fatty acid-binding protein, liver-like [Aphidius gifuensis]